MIHFLRQMERYCEQWDDDSYAIGDESLATYCAPCFVGFDRVRSAMEVPKGYVVLMEDDEGICCNCGRSTSGDMLPGRCGQERWIQGPFEITIYELGMGYGGPQEGGWWYGTGYKVRTLKRTFEDMESAVGAMRRVNGWLERMRPSWVRPVSSVAYTGGAYEAQVAPVGTSVEGWPNFRPQYD